MNGYLNIRMENKYLDNKKQWKRYYAIDNKELYVAQACVTFMGRRSCATFYRVHFCTNVPTFSSTATNNLDGVLY